LRSAVQMSDVDRPPRVLQITSTLPGEGKTTIAMTIAASAAQSGLKTLLVDADLRHPSASRYFKADKRVGLVDYLVGAAELKDALVFNDELSLYVLPSGAKTQNPPDLLGSDRFKALIEALKSQFELIVLDTPPMGPVVDPLIVAQAVDKIAFVVRWAATAREMTAHSIDQLGGHGKVAGVVFNYVVDAQAQKYGRYAYSYYYGGRAYRKYYNE
jgi:capsular exopolysaccharide synthesis family protein